ncbi:MAG: NAD-dependent epimerase/dehydratase family protein [Acidothermaceae bacterium]
MRVLVVGATGVVGRRLVPLLVSTGHDVVGGTTSPTKLAGLEQLGATGVVLDVLDAEQTRKIVADAAPDAIVHQATALANMKFNPRHFDTIFATTNLLRTAGTRNLLAAAEESGVERFVAHSFCGWTFARTGGPVKTEEDALDPNPMKPFTKTLAAIKELERLVTDDGGVVLRCGGFYGPGTSLDHDGEQATMVRKRRLPIVGDGAGVFSFVHVDDVASATLAALTRGSGIYNIVDDEPAAARDWIPYLAGIMGAKPPIHIPAWLARLAAGETTVAMMTQARGGVNAKAKRELSWKPQYASWRDGFAHELGDIAT